MTKSLLHIAYDGPALEDGSMDVRELAPALLAISETIERANEALGGQSPITVKVRADFKRGSFEVVLEVAQSVAEQLRMALGTGVSAANILKHIGLTATSGVAVIKLIKALSGKRVKKTQEQKDGSIVIEADGARIEITREVAVLYTDHQFRSKLKAVVDPLRREGISSFQVRHDGNVIESVSKDEAKAFALPEKQDIDGEAETVESIRVSFFTVVGLSFEDGKWRLSDGEAKIWASISDDDFKGRIDRGEIAFRKGDQLKAELVTSQTRAVTGALTSTHEVRRVIEHRQPPQQISMNLDGGDDE